jgi:hypothetical protein
MRNSHLVSLWSPEASLPQLPGSDQMDNLLKAHFFPILELPVPVGIVGESVWSGKWVKSHN